MSLLFHDGRLRPIALVLCAFFFFAFARADTADADLDAANRAYTSGSYNEAAGLFQKMIDTRGYSAALCFDLANAEDKAGHPGRAMLNYERARYLAPADAAIDHNLQLARKQAGLEPNSYRWWQTLMRSIDWTVWFTLIVTCLALLLLALIAHTWMIPCATALHVPPGRLALAIKAVFFFCIPLALLFGFVELDCLGFNNRIEGVIVAPKTATLRLSPFDSADSVGTIPEGELVTVEDRHNDYLRIEARDRQFGWIQQKDLEPVIAGTFDVKAGN